MASYLNNRTIKQSNNRTFRAITQYLTHKTSVTVTCVPPNEFGLGAFPDMNSGFRASLHILYRIPNPTVSLISHTYHMSAVLDAPTTPRNNEENS